MKDLEAQLQESVLRRQLGEVQKHLELMEEEKRELEVRVQRAEERSSSMEHQGGWQVTPQHHLVVDQGYATRRIKCF